jgi:hypothetical protein
MGKRARENDGTAALLYGRRLQFDKRDAEAMTIFPEVAKRYPQVHSIFGECAINPPPAILPARLKTKKAQAVAIPGSKQALKPPS